MTTEFERIFNTNPSLKKTLKFIKHRHFSWPFAIRRLRKKYPKVGLKPGAKISGYVEIGEYTFFWGFPSFYTYGKNIISEPGIRIGKFCSISNVYCSTGVDNHYTHLIATYPVFLLRPDGPIPIDDPNISNRIEIGNDVWIGRNVSILGDVSIGNGVIIGSNSVVTRDVPSYHIVAGNPAKVKKMRYPENIIRQLEVIKWWDWPIEKIKRNVEFFKVEPAKDENITLTDYIID